MKIERKKNGELNRVLTEANRGTKLSTKNGIIVRNNIGAINASSLNGMIGIRVENRVQVSRPCTHC